MDAVFNSLSSFSTSWDTFLGNGPTHSGQPFTPHLVKIIPHKHAQEALIPGYSRSYHIDNAIILALGVDT